VSVATYNIVATFADKIAVRDYVADTVGEHYLPRLYVATDTAAVLLDADLPRQYVLKPSHGSGAVIVVSDAAAPDARLPAVEACWAYTHVRPEHVDRTRMVAIAQFWLEQLYGQGPNKEWAYGKVPRRVLAEELLTGDTDTIADDYKFSVFHGRCEFVSVAAGRFTRRTQTFYRRPRERLPLSGGPPTADHPQPAPAALGEMIDVAERLAGSTDFVRVDLYAIGDRVVFGELTNYPAGGHSSFDPQSFDHEFGRFWTVPRRYRRGKPAIAHSSSPSSTHARSDQVSF
jgi:hypothetical protein